jgi:hypothetical protein
VIRSMYYKIGITIALLLGLLTGVATYKALKRPIYPKPSCFISPFVHPSTYHRHLEVIRGAPWACDDVDGKAFCYALVEVPSTECKGMMSNLNKANLRYKNWERESQKKMQEEEREERSVRVRAMWDILDTLEDIRQGKIQLKEAEKKYGK